MGCVAIRATHSKLHDASKASGVSRTEFVPGKCRYTYTYVVIRSILAVIWVEH
jgi:hypothetical protein